MHKNRLLRKSGQSIIEYLVIMSVILTVASSGILVNGMRASFQKFFNAAVEKMR